jgi:hypothetical protein
MCFSITCIHKIYEVIVLHCSLTYLFNCFNVLDIKNKYFLKNNYFFIKITLKHLKPENVYRQCFFFLFLNRNRLFLKGF